MRQFTTALLIFVAFCASAAPETDPIATGRAALDRGDVDQAMSQFEHAVAAQPNSAAAHYYLGLACGQKGQNAGIFGGMSQIKRAVDEWNRALALDPGYFNARMRLIEFYTMAAQSDSNFARGEEALRKYLAYKPAEDEPALGNAWYWLGMIQEKQGKKAEARQSYANAQKLLPEAKDVAAALKRVS